MGLLLGDIAPDFQAVTTEGSIGFHDWIGGEWAVFLSPTQNAGLQSFGFMSRQIA